MTERSKRNGSRWRPLRLAAGALLLFGLALLVVALVISATPLGEAAFGLVILGVPTMAAGALLWWLEGVDARARAGDKPRRRRRRRRKGGFGNEASRFEHSEQSTSSELGPITMVGFDAEADPDMDPAVPFSRPSQADWTASRPAPLSPAPRPTRDEVTQPYRPSAPAPFGQPEPASSRPMPLGPLSAPLPLGRSSTPMPLGGTSTPMPLGRSSAPMPLGRSSAPMPLGRSSAPMPLGRSSAPMPLGRSSGPAPFGRSSEPMPLEPSSGQPSAPMPLADTEPATFSRAAQGPLGHTEVAAPADAAPKPQGQFGDRPTGRVNRVTLGRGPAPVTGDGEPLNGPAHKLPTPPAFLPAATPLNESAPPATGAASSAATPAAPAKLLPPSPPPPVPAPVAARTAAPLSLPPKPQTWTVPPLPLAPLPLPPLAVPPLPMPYSMAPVQVPPLPLPALNLPPLVLPPIALPPLPINFPLQPDGTLAVHDLQPEPNAWTLAMLSGLHWRRFEAVVETLYRQAGFRVRTQPHGSNGGLHIWLYSRHQVGPPVSVVRCERGHGVAVGVALLRELSGVMFAQGARRGHFVSGVGFSPEAIEYAKRHGIHLLDVAGLLALIQARSEEQQRALMQAAVERP